MTELGWGAYHFRPRKVTGAVGSEMYPMSLKWPSQHMLPTRGLGPALGSLPAFLRARRSRARPAGPGGRQICVESAPAGAVWA